jgi:hypothetical protein
VCVGAGNGVLPPSIIEGVHPLSVFIGNASLQELAKKNKIFFDRLA